mmetsp:Transcript_18858/g.40668  ORF Transcript_18858/g.40668 Transcript_18858/m.40668 type:complete len:308 (-) Transcript_18858:997-1920(-)
MLGVTAGKFIRLEVILRPLRKLFCRSLLSSGVSAFDDLLRHLGRPHADGPQAQHAPRHERGVAHLARGLRRRFLPAAAEALTALPCKLALAGHTALAETPRVAVAVHPTPAAFTMTQPLLVLPFVDTLARRVDPHARAIAQVVPPLTYVSSAVLIVLRPSALALAKPPLALVPHSRARRVHAEAVLLPIFPPTLVHPAVLFCDVDTLTIELAHFERAFVPVAVPRDPEALPVALACEEVSGVSCVACLVDALAAEVVVHPIALVRLVVRPLPAALAVAKQMAELALVHPTPLAVERAARQMVVHPVA